MVTGYFQITFFFVRRAGVLEPYLHRKVRQIGLHLYRLDCGGQRCSADLQASDWKIHDFRGRRYNSMSFKLN